MVSKLRLVFAITIVFFCFYGKAQDTVWSRDNSSTLSTSDFSKRFDVKSGAIYSFDEEQFKQNLKTQSRNSDFNSVVQIPDVSGKMITFGLTETSVMADKLSDKYPDIKSYTGHALDDSGNTLRLSVSHKGIQGLVIHTNGTALTYLQKSQNGKYVVYSRNSHTSEAKEFLCATKDFNSKIPSSAALHLVNNQELRKYRIAIAATGEYTQYHGGTVADALAAINASLTRINGLFENDLGVRLELIATNDQIVFVDPNTDPYQGVSTTQAQAAFTDTIGEENYDIGILFGVSENSNGNAGRIGSVCRNNIKGSSFASAPIPEGDVFDIDFVAHEIGHQFGANHTWSFETEGTGVQVEPGSGTTIMGYAGITGPNNVASNSDDYFHYSSIVQVTNYLATTSCAEIISLINNPPIVEPTGSYTIPKSTAFVLTGSASDPDSNDVLTYAWEQIDNGVVTFNTFGPNNPVGGNFRSQIPSVQPERYFPALSSVLQGMLTQQNPNINSTWETVSDIEREMNFALTVRDNVIGAGQLATDLVNIFFEGDAGPFRVTSQQQSFVATAGSVQTITWDVANTNMAPINAQNVDIFLSLNGGNDFPILLAEGVHNDGSHAIVLPGNATNFARIMIKASDNIFFAVNSAQFAIEASEVVLDFEAVEFDICQPENLVIPFNYETFLGFNEEVTFSIPSPPVGLTYDFAPNTATDSNTPIQLSFSDTQNVTPGNYPITVVVTSVNFQKEIQLNVTISDGTFDEVSLLFPEDASTEISRSETLTWSEDTSAIYTLEIATDANFANIIESEIGLITNSYTPRNLEFETTYYWRIKPSNSCGEGFFSVPNSFTTINFSCATRTATDLPRTISENNTPTVSSTISLTENFAIADINVSLAIEHTFLSDLNVTLSSPQGTVVSLFSSSCGSAEDVSAVFDDQALSTITCSGQPAINGQVQPEGFLSSFNGESTQGDWVLTVFDSADNDGGSIQNFSLEICVEGMFRPDADNDGVYDDGDDLCLDTPPGVTVDAKGCPVFNFSVNNFSIAAQSETCRNNNDGILTIEALENLNYSIEIVGGGVTINDSFTTNYSVPNLGAAIYTVCIDGSDGVIMYEQRCFEVVISEPETLGVTSRVSLSANLLELDLSGGSLYNIDLNGVVTQTTDDAISLNLKKGINTVKVTTSLECQGIYEEQIFVSATPLIYPNPFDEAITITFPLEVGDVNVSIFSIEGKLMKSELYAINGGAIQLNLSDLPAGIYNIQYRGEKINSNSKIIKL